MFKILFLFLFSLQIFGLEATITLEDGTLYTGSISARSIQFKDIFRKEKKKFRLREIYKVDLLYETISQNLRWKSKKKQEFKEYILAITTWSGERYWGRVRWSIKLKNKKKSHRFVFPKKQVVKQKRKFFYAKKLILKAKKETKKKPSSKKFPSLKGKLSSYLNVANIFALHCELGVFFEGQINDDNYKFEDILPGNYDLILMTKKGLIFSLTKPRRKTILDRAINFQNDRILHNWIEGQSNFQISYTIMFYIGHLSDTRILIMEQTKNTARYLLWISRYGKNIKKWAKKNYAILYEQKTKKNDIIPKLFFDRNLGNIKVVFGQKIHNYLP